MSQLEQPVLPPADLYRMVRSQIEFEDGLITQRLSWFMAAQSFLFTAYAINLNGTPTPATWDQHVLVSHMIPVVAIASCVLIYCGILAGIVQQGRLRDYLKDRVAADAIPTFPEIHGTYLTRTFGMAAPGGLPVVFVIVWIVLFTHGG